MGDVVIKVEGLGKRYLVGHNAPPAERYTALRDVIARNARNLARKTWDMIHGRAIIQGDAVEEFWALKDLNIEIKQGERVGIIGRNGAGKSTLLKILGRITEPTTGRVSISGRMASLLEVGTGFHPELSGRENIFLNGAILGMTRKEIRRKFEEIVAFAEIEKFLDTPVKRYSSGMYVRLAFAVAAHLEPEILVVDEVLAVGDIQFQKKCLGKMEEVGKAGRTVLFVSHNMTAIRNLCESVVWLKNGEIWKSGVTADVLDEYLEQSGRTDGVGEIQDVIASLPVDPAFRLESISVRQGGKDCSSVLNGLPVEIVVGYEVFLAVRGLRVYVDLCDEDQNILIRSFNDEGGEEMSEVQPGRYLSKVVFPADLLAPRSYELRVCGTIFNQRSIPPGGVAIPLHVEKSNDLNRGYPLDPVRSKLQPRLVWETVTLDR